MPRPSKLDEDVKTWMKQYGLTQRVFQPKVIEHLRNCTELGREIMLIIMKLDQQRDWAKQAKAAQGRIGSESKAKGVSRRAREREMRELYKMAKAMRPKLPPRKPVQAVRIEPNAENVARVNKLMALAGRRYA